MWHSLLNWKRWWNTDMEVKLQIQIKPILTRSLPLQPVEPKTWPCLRESLLARLHTCFILASSLRVCSSFLKSFLLPTRMMGTLGQKCFTSGVHFSEMFSVFGGKKSLKKEEERGGSYQKKGGGGGAESWSRTLPMMDCSAWSKDVFSNTSPDSHGIHKIL